MSKQTRIRRSAHDAENHYFMSSRRTAQDKSLTYEARGLLFYLLSKPSDWVIQIKDLQCEGAGRDKVYGILRELTKRNYMSREFIRDQGKIGGIEYIAYEEPFTEKPYTAKPFTAKPDYTEDRLKQNTDKRHIPEPKVPASMGMRLPRASKRDDEEVSYGDEGAKVVAPKSALHVWVLSHVPGTKALAKTSVAKLYQEVLLPDGKTTPTPSALYDNAPLYREWLTAKVLAYFKTQTHESPSGAAKHLINLICRFQAFTDPQHGYFAYVSSVNVLEKAQERQQRATDEIINTVKPDGTGEVPGWMRDADSLDDGVFS